MSLFVTRTLGMPGAWAGIVLGVAAALEIPALLAIGRLSRRYTDRTLLASGCVAGVAYYAGMAVVASPAALLALQALNAVFYAAVAGVGLTLFQAVIPRPGLASGLFLNTRRVGAIVAGAIIGLGSHTSLGYGGVFAVCATLALAGLAAVGAAARVMSPRTAEPGPRRARPLPVTDR
jgi:SET family sugar efflux transporter-like MFS transporter